MASLAKHITEWFLRRFAPDGELPSRIARRLRWRPGLRSRLRRAISNAVQRLKGAPDALPLPPARLMFLVQGTTNVREFLTDGRTTALEVVRVLEANGVEMRRLRAILDFGCGCGRVLRHLRSLTDARLHGSDYNRVPIDWCRRKLRFASFEVNDVAPPLAYSTGEFDLVYALSVFTHLPENLQSVWLSELTRILRPGGHLLMTTHGECYLSLMSEPERQSFRSGRLVVREVGAAGSNRFFAAHPPEYVQAHLPRDLRMVAFVPETRRRGEPPSRLCWQDGYLLTKRSG
jgi:SAM-dependent methyltransferase